jgi:ATP-binding cassette, subfamily B, bacterial PglK
MKIKKLWDCLPRRRHKQFSLLLVLMVFTSLTEVISIGAVLPFLGLLTVPDQVFQHPDMQSIIQIFQITNASQLLLPMVIIFIITALVAGFMRLVLLYVMTKISFSTGADLSIEVYRRTLYQEYSVHMDRNTSEIINSITLKTNLVINGIIRPVLTFISSLILIASIFIVLFTIDSLIAIFATCGFGFIYLLVILITRKKIKKNSICIAKQSTQMVKALQEGLGGIRDVLIDGTQKFYCQLYQNADHPFRSASASNAFLGGSPRYIIESIGMAMIAILAFGMSTREGGVNTIVPILGAFALGAQRLLPAMQQAYSSYNGMKGTHASFEDVLSLLAQPIPDYLTRTIVAPISFKNSIKVKNIGFRYTVKAPFVLKGVDFELAKGSRTGITGVTGGGKSTLLDIIMGLLLPTKGELLIDGNVVNKKNRSLWQANIAHVPQHIYLSDGTIEDNIAFGVAKDKINHQQVREAAHKAKIGGVIESWVEGYKTPVGELGVKLSGGQRQRIGIARAFYKQVSVLIFDEATSSLDSETELEIMKEIDGMEEELTIIIVAHRVTTLKGCDTIIKLDKDSAIQVGAYKDIINL